MAPLTSLIARSDTLVGAWMRTTFPHVRELQADVCAATDDIVVALPSSVAAGTQGAAVDWWLRILVAPTVPLDLARRGLFGRRTFRPAAQELLCELDPDGTGLQPARFADRSDTWWAGTCYALALLVELYRNPMIRNSPLFQLPTGASTADLRALAGPAAVTDLIAMRELARQRLLPQLPVGPAHAGPAFDGSRLVPADADLIVAGTLLDIKAGQGGQPRQDGTRSAALARTDVHQLLGYVLMDTFDRYRLRHVGIYFARFGHLARWPVTDVLAATTGDAEAGLAALREQFTDVLQQTHAATDQARAERLQHIAAARAAAGAGDAAAGRRPRMRPSGMPPADAR